jgi:hypothetical protein
LGVDDSHSVVEEDINKTEVNMHSVPFSTGREYGVEEQNAFEAGTGE